MSSRIYFQDNNKNVLRYLVRALSESYRFIFPQSAERRLRKLLLTPQSRQPATIPPNIYQQTIDTEYGSLATYSLGKGPIVLFVHGWSGSGSQFFPLMEKVAAMGYCAVTFDHYRHGYSKGKENNYLLFIKTIALMRQRLSQQGEIAAIVSHSMGCSATLDAFKDSALPHFLIAPLLNFYGELESRIVGIGISRPFFEKIMRSIEMDYGMKINEHDPLANIHKIDSQIHIVHSRSDQFALYHYSQSAADQNKAIVLNTLDNIGHMRIVSAPETEAALMAFLQMAYNKKPLALIPSDKEQLLDAG